MPELPEVENVRLSLLPLIGRRVVHLTVNRWDVVNPDTRSGSRRGESRARPSPEALLKGGTLHELARCGKHLAVIAADGRAMDVQLGMSGQMLAAAAGSELGPKTHLHVIWTFDDGSSMGFRDPRRFGGIWPAENFETLRNDRWGPLGPDALTISAEALGEAFRSTKRTAKAVLMDQGAVAGLGNIYVAEALFRAGIRPTRPAGRVTALEVARLAEVIREILEAAIRSGGSTLRDYVNARGERGRFASRHLVYGRGGEPCTICGLPLHSKVLLQRATVWCRRCQR